MRHRVVEAEKPIFLTGTGRCGSGVTYRLLAMHPDLAWISSWVNAFPALPMLAVASRIWNVPAMDRLRGRRFLPNPVELLGVFSGAVENYETETVTEQAVEEARAALAPVLERIRRYHGKPRFLSKYVGRPSKVSLLAELYPDAYFIHVTRELKPTVSSLMKVAFYRGWGSLEDWTWDVIPERYLDYFERCGRPEAVGAAITVKLNRDVIERQLACLEPSRWLEVRYADFVESPVESLRRVADHTELNMDERFIGRVSARPVHKDSDQKWRRHFSDEQVEMLEGFEALA